MGLLDMFKATQIKGPIFDKDFDVDSNLQLKMLNDLLDKVGDDQKPLVENEIKLVSIGLQGEKNVVYQLKSSFLPLLCLHDITLQYQDLTSQMDFVVITNNFICVIETKKLIGDIEVNADGDFIRIYKTYEGKVFKKEGMPSPISQNQKHIDVLNVLLRENNIIKNVPIISLVVISNPKSVVNKAYASAEIQNQIIKYDQITNKLKSLMNEYSNININEKKMLEISRFLSDSNINKVYDYVERLGLKIKEETTIDTVSNEESEDKKDIVEVIEDVEKAEKHSDDDLYEELKQYRANKAKDTNQKLYYIFNNEQLAELVISKPIDKESFIKINGFADKKFEMYGKEITNIIKKYVSGDSIQLDDKVTNSESVLSNKTNDAENKEKTVDENDPMYIELKQYRYNKSKSLDIKPYFIFNNEQLSELITLKPQTKDEFVKVKGLDEKRYNDFGNEIINIIKKHTTVIVNEKDEVKENKNQESPLYMELKQYRSHISKCLDIKPYLIFNNEQFDSLVEKMPLTKEEFITINGFAEKKYETYGNDIIEIIKKHKKISV